MPSKSMAYKFVVSGFGFQVPRMQESKGQECEESLVQTERARLTEMVALFKAGGGGWDPQS